MRLDNAPVRIVGLALFVALTGCQISRHPPNRHVIRASSNPENKKVATLSEESSGGAAGSLTYLVTLGSLTKSQNQTTTGDQTVFEATGVYDLQLKWLDNENLIIACDHCSVTELDILAQANRIGSVFIRYEGLPLQGQK